MKFFINTCKKKNIKDPQSGSFVFTEYLDAPVTDGETLIRWVDVNLCKFLISQGADTDVRDDRGAQLLEGKRNDIWSVSKFFWEIDCLSPEKINQEKLSIFLKEALWDGKLKTCKKLISMGAKINGANGDEETNPLYFAITGGNAEVCKYLISNGAEFNHSYILNQCAKMGYIDLCRYFLSKGVNVNGKDKAGKTALFYAVENYNLTLCRYLISQGASATEKDNEGKTALHYAAKKKSPDLCRYLISQGASATEKDNEGRTPLHCMVEDCNRGGTTLKNALTVCDVLIEAGADINAEDNEHHNVLYHVTKISNHGLELCKFLVEKGANAEGMLIPLTWKKEDQDYFLTRGGILKSERAPAPDIYFL